MMSYAVTLPYPGNTEKGLKKSMSSQGAVKTIRGLRPNPLLGQKAK
jgi:hypothetical protein